jgi:hypothetical protein
LAVARPHVIQGRDGRLNVVGDLFGAGKSSA